MLLRHGVVGHMPDEDEAEEDDCAIVNGGQPTATDGPAAEAEDGQAADEAKITLKIKSSVHEQGRRMRIGMQQPLGRLFAAYKAEGEKAGWLPPGTDVTFKFDGDKVGDKQTPASLDLEEDEVIDACW